MRAALLAAVTVLATACSARASEVTRPLQLPLSACHATAPRLFRTGLAATPRADCCPTATRCAGFLGATLPPHRRHRFRG